MVYILPCVASGTSSCWPSSLINHLIKGSKALLSMRECHCWDGSTDQQVLSSL